MLTSEAVHQSRRAWAVNSVPLSQFCARLGYVADGSAWPVITAVGGVLSPRSAT